MTRRRERNAAFGQLVARCINNSEKKQSTIATELGIDERELRRIKSGQVPASETTRRRLGDVLGISDAEMSRALKTGVAEALNENLQWIRENHQRIEEIARAYYGDLGVLNLPIVARADWLPDKPMYLRDLDRQLKWREKEPEPTAPRLGILNNELYSQFLSRVAKDVQLSNDFCYRLIEITGGGNKIGLTFSPSRYFNFVDSCEVLSFELGSWCFRNKEMMVTRESRWSKADFMVRGSPSDIFSLRKRSACAGLCTFLLLTNTPKGNIFYVHERASSTLLENPGGWHVVPAGTFQPDSAEDVNHQRDFSLSRSVIREFAEELLGVEEVQSSVRTYNDFLDDPRLGPYRAGLDHGSIQAYFLGLGLSALSAKPDILTALRIDASRLPAEAVRFVDNWEGKFLAVPLDKLGKWACDTRMHPSGAACLQLAQKHIEFLVRN